jgi:adenosine deaminase
MHRDLIRRLPKTDLHVHLDGSLRLTTLIDIARQRRVALPAETEDGLRQQVFRERYRDLAEYLEGFQYAVAVLQDKESLERAAFELAEDCQAEGVRYLEVRFAPQLHVQPAFTMPDVVRAVDRGLRRAADAFNRRPEIASGEEPRFAAGIILCALRFFLPQFSSGYRQFFEAMPEAPPREVYAAASMEVARAAARLSRDEGLLVVGVDLAGKEKGYPAEDHRQAYQVAHGAFLGKTVHAGEDYGPESIFQAITDLHADRIGHGTWLFDHTKVHDPKITDKKRYVEELAQYVADKRVTVEVCLTSSSPPTCVSTPSERCAGASSPPSSARTTGSSPTRTSRTRSRGRWRRSTSPSARSATFSSMGSSAASSRGRTSRSGRTCGR